MEYVIVKYPASRDVYINGARNGKTNESLRVGAGTQVFDLGSPADYQPANREVVVENTSVLEPMEIEFEPAAGAAPEGGASPAAEGE